MRRSLILAALTGVAATIAALALPAVAGADGSGRVPAALGHLSTVYVQTNDPTGNQIVTYVSEGGGLHPWGGPTPEGSASTSPARRWTSSPPQGSLASDAADGLLVAVNGGSNTISVFHAFGPFLSATRVVLPSGGTTPVSVAVRGDLIYVLNAGGTGSIQGYYADSLTPVPGSHQSLGLTPGLTPAFLNTPGQIGFTADGRQIVVTTKAQRQRHRRLQRDAVGLGHRKSRSSTPRPHRSRSASRSTRRATSS